ncbi:piggyBac transposable element-derived protein 4-like [Vespula maculifrons]|uniref:PiggyBac transposable element-derived protein 4-like n=1 Tax=Vespula maculifrons TaxID=7453 RepID=A0ABD2BHN1_VESMC
MKCHLIGTTKTNTKNVPTILKKPKFYEKRTVAYKKGNTMLLVLDKRIVSLLNTWHNADIITTRRFIQGGIEKIIEMSSLIVGYTKSMIDDRAGQLISLPQSIHLLGNLNFSFKNCLAS